MRNFYVFARVALFCIAWLVGFEGLAQSRYWVGGSGNWSDSQHWSYESGGLKGAPVPTSSDAVVIDKNSFIGSGVITISQDVSIKSLIWTIDAKQFGLSGNGSITVNGSALFESENSADWKGNLILTSSNKSFLKITSRINANINFSADARYDVIRSVNTGGSIVVNGDNVDFKENSVKAKKITASDVVKATMRSGFLKATQGTATFQIMSSVVNETCPGKSDGSIKITSVTGGVENSYSYMWLDINEKVIPGQTGLELNNVKKDKYYFVVTGRSLATNKTVTDYFPISVEGPVTLIYQNAPKPVDATCNGTSGSIEVAAVFGVYPYTYYLNDVSYGTDNPILNVPAGTYNLKIIDDAGCAYPYPTQVEVKQPNPIVLNVTPSPVTGCSGNANGSIVVKATGGTADSPLECSRDGNNYFPLPDAGYTFDNLSAGDYTITVRRVKDHSCQKTAPVKIDQPLQLSATATVSPVTGCSDVKDGKIDLSNIKGGSGSYQFSIDGGNSWVPAAGVANPVSYIFPNLTPQLYGVWIQDFNNKGCKVKVADLEVKDAPLLTATVTSSEITCNNTKDGKITIASPQGGSGIYDYALDGVWQAGSNSGTGGYVFSGLGPKAAPGYIIQIRDNKNQAGCVREIGKVVLAEPAAITVAPADIVANNVTGCSSNANGSIDIKNPTGGYGTYQVSNDGANWIDAPAGMKTTIGGLIKGTYPITIRDKKYTTCSVNLGSKVIGGPDPITGEFDKTDVTGCQGSSTGTITFKNVKGGSGTYAFSIEGDNNYSTPAGNKFTGVSAGNHDLWIKNLAGEACPVKIGVANIIDAAPLSAMATPTSSCAGTANGTIEVKNPSGGSGAYNFSLDNIDWKTDALQKGYIFNNLAGNKSYPVYIQDAKNTSCSRKFTDVTVGEEGVLSAKVAVKAGCPGMNNGSIIVTEPTGAPSGIYEYSLDGGAWGASSTFSNLSPKTYSVSIREKGSKCSTKLGDSYVVAPLSAITAVPSILICNGDNTGSITVNVTGGTPPLLYSRGQGVQSGNVFSNLLAGTYTITVSDAAGCAQTKDVTIAAPAKIVPTVDKVDIGCATKVGQITISSVTGGSTPYQYSNTGGNKYQDPNVFTGLSAGPYLVKVQDKNGCASDVQTVTIESKPILDVVLDHVVDVKPCKGNSTGSIVLNIKTGAAPYKYKLGSSALADLNANGIIDNLKAGIYDVTVVDANGCSVIIPKIIVNEPTIAFSGSLDLKNSITEVTVCPGNGTIKVDVTGGAQPYAFSKDNGISYTPVAAGISNYTFQNLLPNSYNVKAKDANGCEVDLGAVTIAPSSLSLTATPTDITCKGGVGKVDVSVSGGKPNYQFAFNDDNYKDVTSFTSVRGTYTVKVKDAGGCIASKPVTISEPATAVQATIQSFDVSCGGAKDGHGHITVQATGGTPSYTITLNSGVNIIDKKTGVSSADFTGLGGGTYTIEVIDSKCTIPFKEDKELKEPTTVSITTLDVSETQPTCSTPAKIVAVATVSGTTSAVNYDLIQGTTVVATNTTGQFDNVAPGNYVVKASVGKCASKTSDKRTINNPLASGLALKIGTVTQIKCFGDKGSIEAAVEGGANYPTSVNVTLAGPSTVVTFDRATGKVTASDLVAGTYTFTLTDGTCSQTQTVTISKGPDAALSLGDPTISRPTTATSTDGSIAAAAAGGTPGYNYTLTPADPLANPIPSTTGMFGGLGIGKYSLSVVDSKGCRVQKDNLELTKIPDVVTADVKGQNIKCAGTGTGQIDVTVNSGLAPYTITVATTATAVAPIVTPNATYSIMGLAKGDYTVSIKDANGTSITPITITISEPLAALTLGLSNATPTLCFGDSNGKIDIAANGGTTPYKSIIWLGDKGTTGTIVGTSGTASNLGADKYTVTVTDAAGCTASASHTIAGNKEIVVVAPPVNPTCGGNGLGSITVTASGGTTPPAYTYSKDGSTFVSSGSFTNLPVGTYKIVVKDGVGCPSVPQQVEIKSSSSIVIVEPVQKTDAHCGVNGTITVVATGGSGDLTYNLRRSGKKDLVASNKTGRFIDVPGGNKYFVEVTDGGTCPATSSTITIAAGGTSSITEIKRNVDNILCNGGTGRFTVWVKGVVGAIQYDVLDLESGLTLQKGIDYNLNSTAGANPGEYTVILSDIRAGKFKLQIWDDNSCPQSFAFAFTNPEVLKVDKPIIVNPKSKTSNDGSITVVASGGAAPYVYTLCDESGNILVDGNNDPIINNDGIFENLAPGKYLVKVKGQGDCEASSEVVELVAQSNLEFDNVITTNPTCHGNADGTIEIYATGGVGKLSYSIHGNVDGEFKDSNIFNNLAPGEYEVVVKDEIGVPITQKVTLVDPDEVKLTLVQKTLPSAGTVSDGSITVIATGGTGNYTISIIDKAKNVELMHTLSPSVEVSFSKLQSSTYRIVAIDDNGCTAVLDPVVLERLSIVATASDVTCGNATTGKIDVTIKGGTEPYKISWKLAGGTDSAPADVTGNTYTIKDIAAGKYTITVTDAAGGSASITKTIKSLFTPIVATVTKVSDPICPEGLNGTIELAISGGKPAYTPTWTPETPNPAGPTGVYTPNATGGVISGLHPSKYSINITDANGCSVVVETAVASTPAIVIESAAPAPAKCNGDGNGSITVKASGGVGELKFSATVDGKLVENTTGQFDNLKAGKYVVTVTDTKNCSVKTAEVEVTEPAALDLKVKEAIDQGCSTPGKITVEVANSTGKITYKLDQTTNETGIFDNLSEGSHTITATNEAGCSATITKDITSTASIKITKVDVTNVLCNGSGNGKLQFDVEKHGDAGSIDGLVVNVNGIEIPRDPGTLLFMVKDLKAGEYTIVAKNSIGCEVAVSYKITEPEKLTATATVTRVPVNDIDNTGELVVNAVGGTVTDIAPYKVSCTNTVTNEKKDLTGTPVTFDKLVRGKYSILVTDANGCSVAVEVTIGAPTITAKGISRNCDPNSKGSIEVTIIDGAKPYKSLTYVKSDDPTVTETKTNINDNVVTFTGVPVGTYNVTLVDASDITAKIENVIVADYVAPTIVQKSTCNVNSSYYVQIEAANAPADYTVSCTKDDGTAVGTFDKATMRITGLTPNNIYHIKLVDANKCESNQLDIDLKELAELKLKAMTPTDVKCNGQTNGSIAVEVEGGAAPLAYYLYDAADKELKNSATPLFEGLAAATYLVKVVDNNGCFIKNPVPVNQPTDLVFTLDDAKSKTKLWCATKSEGVLAFNVADAVPGYTISLKLGDKQIGEPKTLDAPGAGIYENLAVGKYQLVATDKNGCPKTLEPLVDGNHIIAEYDLSNSECRRFVNPDDIKTLGGVFTLKKLSGNFGDNATYHFKKGLNLVEQPVEPASGFDPNDLYYKFAQGVPCTISQLQGLKYSILAKVVDPVNGTCNEEFPFEIGVKPENDFYAVAAPDKTVCINSLVDFTASILAKTDQSKCEYENGQPKLDNNFNPVPKQYFAEWLNVENSWKPVEYADGVIASLTQTQKMTVPDKVSAKKPFKLLHPYIFRVTSSSKRCYDADTANVNVYPFSNPYISGPLVKEVEGVGYFMRMPLGATQNLELKYRSEGFSPALTWYPTGAEWLDIDKDDNKKIGINDKLKDESTLLGTVTYKANDAETCVEYVGLKIVPLSTINPPNAFTPNGDGYNDTWRVIYDEEMVNYPNLEVEVYNRWGSIVYHSKPYKNDWNGKHNGKDLPVGTYYYVIKLHRGNLPNISGGVSIIR